MTKIKLTLLALLLLLLACACDDKTAPKNENSGQPPLVGLFIYRADDAYISLVRSNLEELFAGQARLEVLAGKYDQLTQNEQIEELIRQNPAALIVNLVDTQSAALIVDMAKKADIPVVFFNREPDLITLTGHAGKVAFVGTVPADAGRLQGSIIAGLWQKHPEYDRNRDGKCQFVMFQGNTDNPEAVARTEYSVSQAVALGLRMDQVGETHMCAWDDKLAKTSMSMAFAAHGEKIELVIANNDSMALGAIAALNAAGFNTGMAGSKFIPVVGVDAIPEAIEAIKAGRMSATVVQDAQAMAKAVLALTMNAVRGEDFLAGTAYSWDSSGLAVRIPYAPYGGE